MNRAVLADSGPLYAAIDPNDVHHQRAQRELKRLSRGRRYVIVTYPILLEAHALVLRRMGSKAASAWLDEILKSGAPESPSVEDYLDGVMTLSALPDQSITLFDATLAAMGTRLRMEIWTYDHHFNIMRSEVWRP